MAVLGDTKAISLTLLDGVIGDLNPKVTTTYNLGTSSLKWNNIYGTLKGNADTATKATQDGSGNTITSYYVTLSTAQTISGAKTFSSPIYFGRSGSNGILTYNASNPNYGIWYHDEATDSMTFSASGKANNKTTAELCITGGVLYTANQRIPHTGNTTGTVGSSTQPVYVNAGTITAITGALDNDISGNAETATAISPAGTTEQFWRGDNAWSNTLGISTIDNTAFKNTLILENNRDTESSYATLNEAKPSFGLGFNFKWSSGNVGNLAGIYGVGLSSYRAGLAFRIKKTAGSSTTPGTHDQTVAWMSGDGIVVKGKLLINPSYSTLTNSYNEGLRLNRASNGWSVIELGGTADTVSGSGLGTWLIGAKATPADATTVAANITNSLFYISYNGSDSAACRIQGHNATGFSIRPKLYINTDVPASGTVYNLYVNGTTYLSSDITANGLTASQAVVTDANKKLVSRGITNNTSVGPLGWVSGATTASNLNFITVNTLAYWNGAYWSTNNASNLKYSANGEIMGLSTAQTVSATKTFSAIQKFTNTTDSAHSQDTAAAVSISGGLSVAKKVSAKEVRIDNNQSSKGVSLQYDTTLEVLNFVFS